MTWLTLCAAAALLVALVPRLANARRRRGCTGCDFGRLVDKYGGPCPWCGEERAR